MATSRTAQPVAPVSSRMEFDERETTLSSQHEQRIGSLAEAITQEVRAGNGGRLVFVEGGGNSPLSSAGRQRAERVADALETAVRDQLDRLTLSGSLVQVRQLNRGTGRSAQPGSSGAPTAGAARRTVRIWTVPLPPDSAGPGRRGWMDDDAESGPRKITRLERSDEGWLADGDPIVIRSLGPAVGRAGVALLADHDWNDIAAEQPMPPGSAFAVLVVGATHGPSAGQRVTAPVRTPHGPDEILMDAHQLARVIDDHLNASDPDTDIALVACSSGALPDGFARQLAVTVGRRVLAPQGRVRVGIPGQEGQLVTFDGQPWAVFTPDDTGPWDVVNDVLPDRGAIPFDGITATASTPDELLPNLDPAEVETNRPTAQAWNPEDPAGQGYTVVDSVVVTPQKAGLPPAETSAQPGPMAMAVQPLELIGEPDAAGGYSDAEAVPEPATPESVGAMTRLLQRATAGVAREVVPMRLAERRFPTGLRLAPHDDAKTTATADWVGERLDDPSMAGAHRPRDWSAFRGLIDRAGEDGLVVVPPEGPRETTVFMRAGGDIWRISTGSDGVVAEKWTQPPALPIGVEEPPRMVLAFNKCADFLV